MHIDALQKADLVRRALIADPLNAAALRPLALIADEEGDSARADALMEAVTRRTLRDSGADLWLFERRAREGERVVTTGNFLLDSESRLRATAPSGAGK